MCLLSWQTFFRQNSHCHDRARKRGCRGLQQNRGVCRGSGSIEKTFRQCAETRCCNQAGITCASARGRFDRFRQRLYSHKHPLFGRLEYHGRRQNGDRVLRCQRNDMLRHHGRQPCHRHGLQTNRIYRRHDHFSDRSHSAHRLYVRSGKQDPPL